MAFRLDLDTAQLFVAVVEEASVARAAERAKVTPAVVNKRLRDLEGRLGIGLLERDRKGVAPTPAGRALLRRARALLYEVDQLEREMRQLALGEPVPIRVYTSETPLYGLLPGLLERFHREHPAARVHLVETMNDAVAPAVEQGVADLGLFTGAVPAGSLVVHDCCDDRLVVVMPPDHPLAGRAAVGLAEVYAHEMVGPDPRNSFAGLMMRGAAEQGVTPRMRVRVDGYDVICRLVQRGFGLGIVARIAFDHVGRPLGLVAVPLDEPWARRRFRVCARDPGQLPTMARRLFDLLVAMGEELA